MNRDVAIIGIAGYFPQANNIAELASNLENGKASIREISNERIKRTCLAPEMSYRSLGYIEDIDVFDYGFFNISFAEAQAMSPQQRLLLEVSYHTFENAGYNLESLNGGLISVYSSIADSNYSLMAEQSSPALATGVGTSFIPARICRFFNLVGNSSVIDSSCSSSLVAVHMACNDLLVGESDMALVCAANIELFPIRLAKGGLEVDSPNDSLRPFSSAANGMVQGEIAAAVLLKKLDKARKDRDIIHAVIKTTGVNNNANRSASLSAPDSLTQAEVIKRTWEKAGINPEDIAFIEAHGSGTQLGDTIEVEGLNLAFGEKSGNLEKCYISTIKANIGHCRGAAGIAGLIKAVLSLKKQLIFPMPYFDSPNPFIDMNKSAIRINSEPIPWIKGKKKRLAGVTSIGLSGTNCHLVLEESPERKISKSSYLSSYLVPISAKDKKDLLNNCRSLLQFLQNETPSLKDLAYTLSCGRKHYASRIVMEATDIEELISVLERQIVGDAEIGNTSIKIRNNIFLFAQSPFGVSSECLTYLAENHAVFKRRFEEFLKLNKDTSFGFQYAFFFLLKELGINPRVMAGIGKGKIISDLVAGRTAIDSLNQEESKEFPDLSNADIVHKAKILHKNGMAESPLYIDMGHESLLTSQLKKLDGYKSKFEIASLGIASEKCLSPIIKLAYLSGGKINWQEYLNNIRGYKLELPGYQFKKNRCWIRKNPVKQSEDGKNWEKDISKIDITPKRDFEDELERTVYQSWCKILKINDFKRSDNFFELGGDSLKVSKMILEINKSFEVALSFEDTFDFPVFSDFITLLEGSVSSEQIVAKLWREALKVERIDPEVSLFYKGAHSLIANQVINRLNKTYGLDLNFDIIFEYPTIRKLSALIDKLKLSSSSLPTKTIDIAPLKELYTCSSAQRQLWLASQLREVSAAYNCISSYQIENYIDIEVFTKAIYRLMERHEILRTVFVEVKGEPNQKIISTFEACVDIKTFDFTVDHNKEVKISELIKKEAYIPFNLATSPLLRFRVIKTAEKNFIVVIIMHHIINDSQSYRVLFNELTHFYTLESGNHNQQLPPLEIQYKDYSEWQNQLINSDEFDGHGQFWTNKLNGYHCEELIHPDKKRPKIRTFDGGTHQFDITADNLLKIKKLGGKHETTTFISLMAFVTLLLYRLSEKEDIAVGTPVAGRDHIYLENQIGIFVNTLIIRTTFSKELTFLDFYKNVITNVKEAFRYQHYPFDKMFEDTNVKIPKNRTPFVDIMMQYEKCEFDNNENTGITSYPANVSFTPVDIYFRFREEGGQLQGNILYNSQLFELDSIEYISKIFIQLIDECLQKPIIKLGNLLLNSNNAEEELSVSDINF